MSDFDHVLMWTFTLALVAVIVGSGHADEAIKAIVKVLSQAIGAIGSTQMKG